MNGWWSVRLVIGNQIREYTEKTPGAAFDKLVEEWGEVSSGYLRGTNGLSIQVHHIIRLDP